MDENTTLADRILDVPTPSVLFTPLERQVIDLASRERGRGLRPSGRLGQALEQLLRRLFGRHGIRPLADDRLEALRIFINALHRCGPTRINAATHRFRALGFSAGQERWLRGITSPSVSVAQLGAVG